MARRSLQQFEEQLQDYLELLKTAEYTKLNKVYQRIGALLTSALNELDGDISTLRRSQLEKFLRGIRPKQMKLINDMVKKHKETLTSFAGYSYQIEASILAATTGANIVHATKARAIYQAALQRPLGATGELLESFVDNLTPYQVGIVEKTLRKAHVNGWTTQQTIQLLKGTRKNNYADGLMSRMGKQTATVVRTSMQHVNNASRQIVWAENDDIIKGYRWVSTLDSRTSETCQELDGEVFPIGEGPMPPAHPNCRSTTVAELDDRFAMLSEGRTRSSVDGYVPFDMKYDDWVKTQDDE